MNDGTEATLSEWIEGEEPSIELAHPDNGAIRWEALRVVSTQQQEGGR